MQLQEILDRFESVTEEGDGGYLAICPAHTDSRPSLRLWRGDNAKMRVVCRAGCDSGDVVKSAGLRWPDMFSVTGEGPRVPTERPTMVGDSHLAELSRYLYKASRAYVSGSPAAEYAKERFGVSLALAESLELGYDPGDGFAHTPAAYTRNPRLVVPLRGCDGIPHGVQGRDIGGQCPARWVGLRNPDGHRWGQYGVFLTGDTMRSVIICEGMSDPLTAVAAGYDSIGIRGAALAGTQGLIAELADSLQGRAVYVAGDNDTAGQKFNDAIAKGMAAHGIQVREIRIPDLGPKTDLTKWRESDPDAFSDSLVSAVLGARVLIPKEEEILTGTELRTTTDDLDKRTGVDTVTKEQGREAFRVITECAARYGSNDRGEASDTANAHALVAWTEGRIRYAEGLGFHVWDGRTWNPSNARMRQEIHRMGAALMMDGQSTASRGFAYTVRIDAMIKELMSVPSVYVDADQFDSHAELLSFRNGVVNLRTGALRPHSKEDMITASVDLDYNPSATCPRFEEFLTQIFPGMPDMPPYLQRLIGYGITGSVDEQCFAVLFGKGANGKSVLCDVLADVFKAITRDTPLSTFEEKSSGGIPNDLAALRDARLVTASEGESGKPMSEGVIKKATGDKNMTARFMRQEYFTFTPRFLVLMATNHKPQFKGQDDGLWRRVKLIPFKRFFAPSERDHGLQAKLWEERHGIAAWAVRGAVDWFAGGLKDPTEIVSATQDYRETSNPLDGFVPGLYEIDKGSRDSVKGADLYLDYKDWCEAEGLPLKDQWRRNTLYRHIEDMGAGRRKTADGIRLFGIRKTPLVSSDSDPVEDDGTPDMFKEG
ncbi:phage/plasmid primase, P4 family [Streptomyces sp. N2-109]|uniref:Phage/plasmid primase, P4 family n=1 Tax=Streptomyces gossypii TaxID=2883101 RepID=A0ABT2K2C9_9ACTN|nr:phage/plasmid primase, P4 family [Streptomyces gossypii]MCT2594256.1 phage/plasmid primase, P4 family [Streptomyces gossypii]